MPIKIGVFDSGIGGKTVAMAIEAALPHVEVLHASDSDNVPYGGRNQAEIINLTDQAIQPLLRSDCGVIVIACNTATAAAIEYLRRNYDSVKFIGLEPMIKPAALTTTNKVVAVCATPYTLSSDMYLDLKARYGSGIKILEPDCSSWAQMIENNSMTSNHIRSSISTLLDGGADVIVLACTHYHWIKDEIQTIARGRAMIIDPSQAIVDRVKQLVR